MCLTHVKIELLIVRGSGIKIVGERVSFSFFYDEVINDS